MNDLRGVRLEFSTSYTLRNEESCQLNWAQLNSLFFAIASLAKHTSKRDWTVTGYTSYKNLFRWRIFSCNSFNIVIYNLFISRIEFNNYCTFPQSQEITHRANGIWKPQIWKLFLQVWNPFTRNEIIKSHHKLIRYNAKIPTTHLRNWTWKFLPIVSISWSNYHEIALVMF